MKRNRFRQFARDTLLSHPRLRAFFMENKFCLITSPFRILPNFIIIGVQKSGTTSLYNYLIQHPQIVSSSIKETHFFDRKYYFGLNWYKSHFPTSFYKFDFEKKNKKKLITGEADTQYIIHPLVPCRIKKLLPKVKLIVILRNPVDRAYSQYNMILKANRENLTFEKALENEKDRIYEEREKLKNKKYVEGYKFTAYSYLLRGLYFDQINEWLKLFSKDQIFIQSMENLQEDPSKITGNIFEFLGVEQYTIKNLSKLNVGSYKQMKEETRNWLINYYKIPNEKLFKLLGKKFDWDK